MSNTADLRTWDPKLRREASVVVLAVAGLFLVASLLFFGLNDTGSGWFLWTAIVVLVLALLFEIAVVATGLAREEGGPDWLAGPGAETAAATGASAGAAGGAGGGSAGQAQAVQDPHAHIDLQCPECQDLFSVHDTGERPLHTVCPHCGAEGHVDLGEPAPAAQESAAGAQAGGQADAGGWEDTEDPWADEPPARDLPSISLKCPKCATQFDVEDTGERPLRTTCPGCGSSGKLN